MDPIHQFEINRIVPLELFGRDISFTNSTLFMLVVTAVVALVIVYGTRLRQLVPGRLQSAAEMMYEFIGDTVNTTMGKEGRRFMPLVFSLFLFVLFCNLVGLIPGTFTVTSHIIVTLALAMLVMTTVVGYGFYRHGFKFLGLFKPSGVPAPLLFFIVPIEILSFLSRPVSLSMRLFANMLAGHIALKVFAGFIIMLSAAGWFAVFAPLPLAMVTALTALELLVAVLQAFIFSVLTCIYLNDAIHPGH